MRSGWGRQIIRVNLCGFALCWAAGCGSAITPPGDVLAASRQSGQMPPQAGQGSSAQEQQKVITRSDSPLGRNTDAIASGQEQGAETEPVQVDRPVFSGTEKPSCTGDCNAQSQKPKAEYPADQPEKPVDKPPDQAPVLPSPKGPPTKVFLLIYNPVFAGQGGKTLIEYANWNDPQELTRQVVEQMAIASDGRATFVLEKTVVRDAFTVLTDGYVYTEASFIRCLENHDTCHKPDGANYQKIIADEGVCELVNAGQIDELWIWGGPWFGFWESAMAGKNAFWINGGPIAGTSCQRRLPVMGLNYERLLGEALHSFGHRMESSISEAFGGWDINGSKPFDQFGRNFGQTTVAQTYGCGSIHYPPNATADYQYDSTKQVSSMCDDFLAYPNLTGAARTFGCEAWHCTHEGFVAWWFSHIPRADGTNSAGVRNDWWWYFLEYSHQ